MAKHKASKKEQRSSSKQDDAEQNAPLARTLVMEAKVDGIVKTKSKKRKSGAAAETDAAHVPAKVAKAEKKEATEKTEKKEKKEKKEKVAGKETAKEMKKKKKTKVKQADRVEKEEAAEKETAKKEKKTKKKKNEKEADVGDDGFGASGSVAAEDGVSPTDGGHSTNGEDANASPAPCPSSEQSGGEQDGDSTAKPGSAARAFKRVDAEEWLDKKGAWDNSYVGTFGENGWGYKAQQILRQVRGKDFRHEKTKKKRGSYRGGQIDTDARTSYKFEDSDDE